MKWRSLEESTVAADSRPLRDQLAERKQLIEKYVPEPVRAVHQRTVEQLCNNRMLNSVLSAGAPAHRLNCRTSSGAQSPRPGCLPQAPR